MDGSAIYQSWTEARSDPDAAVVISGDDGGTIYLSVPLRLVRCNGEALARLAAELDATVWDDPTSLGVNIEHLPVGSGIPGGMGGGIVVDDVWLHPREFDGRDLLRARQVLFSAEGPAPQPAPSE
ncbi:hypothetical protein [Leifsonia poae]|uniref:Uncharacterized protein n=1 Tax=Leifsonia poae TaxID=110933 RepID=A0A9W6M1D5_9MICO|nr:hypothetical protein [Leifsonia poae]GLJ77609.1 hypothetical protein GCM10017584_31830 [Leifsonia poae]